MNNDLISPPGSYERALAQWQEQQAKIAILEHRIKVCEEEALNRADHIDRQDAEISELRDRVEVEMSRGQEWCRVAIARRQETAAIREIGLKLFRRVNQLFSCFAESLPTHDYHGTLDEIGEWTNLTEGKRIQIEHTVAVMGDESLIVRGSKEACEAAAEAFTRLAAIERMGRV